MVVGEAVAGVAAAGAHTLFAYNRENFLYDRKQRQEAEFKILEWRCTQAELWREDIRDIIGLTEKKMDSYLIVNTLQLGMVLELFAAGRLEPGTPPWLLHFYMLTLGAAFMYLLMSVWLAMHASIVASCSSVRLLTQFVRLPVPTWEEMEHMRTYGQSVEQLKVNQLLRVPFTGSAKCTAGAPVGRGCSIDSTKTPATASSASASVASSAFTVGSAASPGLTAADPWGLELHGTHREIHELREHPVALRRHVKLAGRAARQYQCFDAFARVAMSFGTVQLLNAVGYYALGQISVQDGAPWPAWCVVMIMSAIALALVHLDFSLTRKESMLAKVLIMAGPSFASVATGAWTLGRVGSETIVLSLLPAAFASHGLWLFFALKTCGIRLQPNGALLPEKFRAVLYLDVFGWLRRKEAQDVQPLARSCNGTYSPLPQEPGLQAFQPQATSPLARSESWRLEDQLEALRRDAALFQSEKVRSVMTEEEKARVDRIVQRVFTCTEDPSGTRSRGELHGEAQEAPLVRLKAPTDLGTEVPYFLDPESGEVSYDPEGHVVRRKERWGSHCRTLSGFEEDAEKYSANLSQNTVQVPEMLKATPAGEHPVVPESAFHPESYGTTAGGAKREQVVTGHAKEPPGRLPAKIFRLATWVLIALWALGTAMPLSVFREFVSKPLMTSGAPLESGLGREKHQEQLARAADGTKEALTGLQDFRTDAGGTLAAGRARKAVEERLPALPSGEPVEAIWPSHSGFVPRALSCDPSGTQVVVADDLGVYAGRLSHNVAASQPSLVLASHGPMVARQPTSTVEFERVPPCAALEGQALQDIGVICSDEAPEAACRVVVLHAHGRRLAQCALRGPAAANSSSDGQREAAKEHHEAPSWAIASDWLHSPGRRRGEYVESIAVENECVLRTDGGRSVGRLTKGWQAEKGCGVVVGTTSGRIVQLRAASLDRHRLVPERAMRLGRSSARRGSLHVFRNGFVLSLQRGPGVLQAFNTRLGASAGKWLLPKGVRWLALCGGGDSLFLLGMRNHSHPELHRFPVPLELQHQAPLELGPGALETSTKLLEM